MSRFVEPTRDLGGALVDLSGRTLYLVAVVGSKVRRFEITTGSKLVIGRSDEADIQIDTPGLSRLHAKLLLEDPLRVQDLGSRNGTRVDGAPISGWHPFRIGQPIELGDVLIMVQDRSATGSINEEAVVPADSKAPRPQTENLSSAKAVISLYNVAERVAQGGLPVLITGESGVGKEHLARFIHERSPEAKGRLVSVDCAAVSADHFTEELFGRESERGPLPGLLRAADGGTLLLDSVDRLPLDLQSRLSRAIETGSYVPVGATRHEQSRFRVIAVSRLDLEKETAQGHFQTELFYRICGVHLRVPPVRACKDGLSPLIEALLLQIQESDGATVQLSDEALEALVAHEWPGNMRELQLTVRRLVALHAGETVDAAKVTSSLRAHSASLKTQGQPSSSADLSADLEKLERQRIISALEANDGNQTKAAKALGISRKVLMRRLDQYSIPRPRKGAKPPK